MEKPITSAVLTSNFSLSLFSISPHIILELLF